MTEQNPLRRIVLVEDEPALRDNYTLALSKAGYDVHGFSDPVSALNAVRQHLPDVAIIDIGLGRDSEAGFDLCRRLRELSARLPILFLTARDSELDVISGLRLGADDYLVKPFAFAELLARVRTLLRRGINTPVLDRLQVGDLVLDLPRRQVTRGEDRIKLTTREFSLLELLVRRQGEVLTRSLIASQVWDMNFDSDTNVIDVAIRRLRAKVDDPYDLKLIHTVRGMGYQLESSLED